MQVHGYSHRPLHRMNRIELRSELERAKKTVEDAAGHRVTAFRAQDFSVLAGNLWALDMLVELGFEVDSSIFPMRSRHYGISGWPAAPHYYAVGHDGSRLLEVPVAIWLLGPMRIPVSGGGYFRVLPARALEAGLRAVAAEGRPAVVYCHPYEFNPDELDDYRGVPRRVRLAQGLGRSRFVGPRRLVAHERRLRASVGCPRRVGPPLNIVFLTVDDPLYLPDFYERVLDERTDVTAIFVVPPLYKGQRAAGAARRYLHTFGLRATFALAARVGLARLRSRSITRVAHRRGVPCERVLDVNAPAFLERLRMLGAELIVSVSCPQIFSKSLIELPVDGCINLHGAVLPEYRGILPSFWMLANGETRGGVSAFFMNEQIDAGDLAGQRSFAIVAGESLDAFVRRSKAVAADLLLDVLHQIELGTVERVPLDLASGSYYSWPDSSAVRGFLAAGHRLW